MQQGVSSVAEGGLISLIDLFVWFADLIDWMV